MSPIIRRPVSIRKTLYSLSKILSVSGLSYFTNTNVTCLNDCTGLPCCHFYIKHASIAIDDSTLLR